MVSFLRMDMMSISQKRIGMIQRIRINQSAVLVGAIKEKAAIPSVAIVVINA